MEMSTLTRPEPINQSISLGDMGYLFFATNSLRRNSRKSISSFSKSSFVTILRSKSLSALPTVTFQRVPKIKMTLAITPK